MRKEFIRQNQDILHYGILPCTKIMLLTVRTLRII